MVFVRSIRSSDKWLAFNQLTHTGLDDHRTLPVLCQLMGATLHERPQTIPIQKHSDRIQLRTSADQCVSLYWGEWWRVQVEFKVTRLMQNIFVQQGMNGGWLRHYSWRCQPVDFSKSEIGLRVSSTLLFSPIWLLAVTQDLFGRAEKLTVQNSFKMSCLKWEREKN